MNRDEMADLTAFVVVAEERSFTKAAAKLGISQSSLSQIVRRVEGRLGLRLLTRTTRSVAPTEAGERLLRTLVPALRELDASLEELSSVRERPAGTIRISSVEHAAKTVIWPVLQQLLPDYPDITVELSLDYGLVDIVAERFDAGVRLGEQVDKDMIAVRIAPDMPMAVVGAPSYFARHAPPKTPQKLVDHACINLRLRTSGVLYPWAFKRKGRELNVRVRGPLVFNTIDLIRDAALAGFGLAYLPVDQVREHLDDGRLVSVLDDWCPRLSGYHLYYPNRKPPAAFALLVEALRYKG
ncbi:LysR family transcriptional regulator [Flavobacterium sp. MXW15]|uniref:LysR family transcriptional regulator n=1 Tax=Xanthomonas chitinilytica TaxID=2989819 RepID=A0ABT3JVY6_9XANT|nr:LysR family transcriptional regulator [Xanthomonas sp. H13-6]MCW4454989.1 LysR family transcriptional regulator [Flavobacterium sp. MXW15]MCW4472384.1 LysR family transcriptional regulator [Xanthomonas sp. H13-6]